MSEIKVNSIKGVGATDAAITVNNSDGTCTANLSNRQNRNLIINGAMQVAQRGTSSTSDSYQTVDRFRLAFGGTDEALTQAQVDVASGTTPYTLGFKKAFKITNGNQTSGAGASDYIEIYHHIEDQDISNSGWNFKSATSFITISFWVKSSVSQKFTGFLYTNNAGQGDSYMYSYQIDNGSGGNLTADTWTKVTHSIQGSSSLTFNNDNTRGLAVGFYLFEGTDLSTPSHTENTWAAWDSSNKIKDMTSTWYTTNDATFEITGVQLEVGSVATDFEHRSFAQELALCQRYYQQSYEHGTSAGTNTNTNSIVWYPDATNNYASVSFGLPVVMRTQPTVTIYSSTGASGKIRNADAATDHNSYVNTNNNSFLMFAVNNSQISQTNTVRCHYTASAEL